MFSLFPIFTFKQSKKLLRFFSVCNVKVIKNGYCIYIYTITKKTAYVIIYTKEFFGKTGFCIYNNHLTGKTGD